jgi:hypothetical protein
VAAAVVLRPVGCDDRLIALTLLALLPVIAIAAAFATSGGPLLRSGSRCGRRLGPRNRRRELRSRGGC